MSSFRPSSSGSRRVLPRCAKLFDATRQPCPTRYTSRPKPDLPRWRNWQTRQLEVLVGVKSRGGSSPLLGIRRLRLRALDLETGRAKPQAAVVFTPCWCFMAKSGKEKSKTNEPTIENRRARHDYFIEDTLECGIKLTGTEIKSVRAGQMSLAEGYVRATEAPLALTLHSAHIAEYPPAGEAHQHAPTRTRVLLANKREIHKLATKSREKGFTLVPLKVYFVRGRAKLLVGLGKGKGRTDKRQDIAKRETRREIDRAMSVRRS